MSEQAKKGGALGIFRGASASTVTIFIIFVLLCVILSIAQPAFLEPNNLLSTARAFSAYAIAGLGVSMVIMTGGIDISVGAIYGLAATIAALAIKGGVPTELALLLGMLTGLVMCPMMSMVATLAFQHPSAATLIPLWFGTFVRNLPFALIWSLLAARPISAAIAERFSAGE